MPDNTKNRLTDLTDILFIQMERLQDDEVCKDKEAIEAEIAKAGAISKLAGTVIEVGNLQLNAIRVSETNNLKKDEMPRLLGLN